MFIRDETWCHLFNRNFVDWNSFLCSCFSPKMRESTYWNKARLKILAVTFFNTTFANLHSISWLIFCPVIFEAKKKINFNVFKNRPNIWSKKWFIKCPACNSLYSGSLRKENHSTFGRSTYNLIMARCKKRQCLVSLMCLLKDIF